MEKEVLKSRVRELTIFFLIQFDLVNKCSGIDGLPFLKFDRNCAYEKDSKTTGIHQGNL